jgi:nucleoside-diphosphate-sugar epimerase
MRVFVTGATGFVGTAVVGELLDAGHQVLGAARSDEGMKALASRGVEAHRGDLTDPASFVSGAVACDATVHLAFIHDFSRFAENIEIEQRCVEAMLGALEGSGKPFIATSGTALLAAGKVATEDDPAAPQGRGLTETMVREAAARGVRTAVIRLPPITHEAGDGGFLPPLVDIARAKGVAAYVGDGANRWPAGNRADAARLYRLALEKGEPGAAYHAIGDEGVPTRDIATAIGKRLGLPTASLAPDQAAEHFGFLGMFATLDIRGSSRLTQQRLGWRPTHAGLIEDIETAPELTGRKLTA